MGLKMETMKLTPRSIRTVWTAMIILNRPRVLKFVVYYRLKGFQISIYFIQNTKCHDCPFLECFRIKQILIKQSVTLLDLTN